VAFLAIGYVVLCALVAFLPLDQPQSANISQNALFVFIFNPIILFFASLITPAMAEHYLHASFRIPFAHSVFVLAVTIDFVLWHAFGSNPSFWPLLIVGGLFAYLLNFLVFLHARFKKVGQIHSALNSHDVLRSPI
jgi:hypothetical protein